MASTDEEPTPDIGLQDRVLGLVAAAAADDGLEGSRAHLQRLCRAAVQELSMRGCALHVVAASGASGVAASSDPASTRVADLAFTTGEGPSLDAVTLRRPILVADLGREPRRWLGFTQAAAEMHIGAVFSFPIQVGGILLGVLDLYADRPMSMGTDQIAMGLGFTELAAATMLGDQGVSHDGVWEPLLDHRAEIHQAQGMIMVDLGIDLAEALVRLRAHAFTEGRALIDIAQEVIAGGSLPSAQEAD